MPGIMSGAKVGNVTGHIFWEQGPTVQLAGEKEN